MRLSRRSQVLLRIGTGITLAFIYVPLAVIVIYAFGESKTFQWPIEGYTLDWFTERSKTPAPATRSCTR